jgi:hypothetical protein
MTYHAVNLFNVGQAEDSQNIEQIFYPYSQFNPSPFDLKINRVHVLLRMYQCTKYVVCRAKDSQYTEWIVYVYSYVLFVCFESNEQFFQLSGDCHHYR